MLVTPLLIITLLIFERQLYHGTFKSVDQSSIFPLPLIISVPLSSSVQVRLSLSALYSPEVIIFSEAAVVLVVVIVAGLVVDVVVTGEISISFKSSTKSAIFSSI